MTFILIFQKLKPIARRGAIIFLCFDNRELNSAFIKPQIDQIGLRLRARYVAMLDLSLGDGDESPVLARRSWLRLNSLGFSGDNLVSSALMVPLRGLAEHKDRITSACRSSG